MIGVLIVDDEPLARQELRRALESAKDLQILGECGDAITAIGQIYQLKPDVVFLDIQMPQITGFEMLGMLNPANMPDIVFLTAYDQYAIHAFEKNAFDYILKPITAERLEITLQRLRGSQRSQAAARVATWLRMRDARSASTSCGTASAWACAMA